MPSLNNRRVIELPNILTINAKTNYLHFNKCLVWIDSMVPQTTVQTVHAHVMLEFLEGLVSYYSNGWSTTDMCSSLPKWCRVYNQSRAKIFNGQDFCRTDVTMKNKSRLEESKYTDSHFTNSQTIQPVYHADTPVKSLFKMSASRPDWFGVSCTVYLFVLNNWLSVCLTTWLTD